MVYSCVIVTIQLAASSTVADQTEQERVMLYLPDALFISSFHAIFMFLEAIFKLGVWRLKPSHQIII